MSLVEKMNWRYATKKFDSNKKIDPDQLADLLTAVQLAPASAGLQSYKVLVIEDPEVRSRLRQVAYGQPQLTDASHLIVFASETNLDEEYVRDFIDFVASERKVGRDTLAAYEQMILSNVNRLSAEGRLHWANKQAYIALGVLLTAAAEMGIDACPMEGFDAAAFDEILGLREKNLSAAVIAAIGFRAQDDLYSGLSKVRKPTEELFIHI